MSNVSCPSCGKSGRMPDGPRGQAIQCPKCGVRFTPLVDHEGLNLNAVPGMTGDTVDLGIRFDDPRKSARSGPPLADLMPGLAVPPAFSAQPGATAPLPALSPPAPKPAAMPMPVEPWYYWFLDVYALICIGLGVLQFAVVLLVYLATSDPAIDKPAAVSGYHVLVSFATLIGSGLVAAPVLLLVDLARNIRVMRWKL